MMSLSWVKLLQRKAGPVLHRVVCMLEFVARSAKLQDLPKRRAVPMQSKSPCKLLLLMSHLAS